MNNQSSIVKATSAAIGTEQWYADLWRERWESLGKTIEDSIKEINEYKEIQQEDALSLAEKHKELARDPSLKRNLLKTARSVFKATIKSAPPEPAAPMTNFVMFLTYMEIFGDYLKYDEYEKTCKCADLLDDLHNFSETLFRFFHNGFYEVTEIPENAEGHVRTKKEKLKQRPLEQTLLKLHLDQITKVLYFASERYSPNYVLGMLLEQMSIDLNIIQQMSHQRSRAYLRGNLFVADAFAKLALKPAIDHGLLHTRYNDVLCYLNRKIEIRLLPYHDTVVIGIPFGANVNFEIVKMSVPPEGAQAEKLKVTVSTDYLAIPHEVGHHLYQYGQILAQNEPFPLGKFLQGRLRERLAEKSAALPTSNWRFRWLEEIFADTYGCLVAGPVSVLGFQEYLANGRAEDNEEDAGKHPISALRPLIQTQILRSITDQYNTRLCTDEPDELDAHWQQWVKQYWPHWVDAHWPYGYGSRTDILREATYEIDGQKMTGHAILEDLQDVIEISLSVLHRLQPESWEKTWTAEWQSSAYADKEKVTGLFAHFKEFAAVELPTAHVEKWLDGLEPDQRVEQEPGQTDQWLTDRLQQLRQERRRRPGIDGLIELLLFNGWSTEGPGAGNVH